MKAYKITGKLGDICSFVGGNEVKKGDMVYFHSESDMKHECVSESQEKRHEWVGLTDDDYKQLHLDMGPMYYYQEYGHAIEAKLKEKNT